MDCKEFEKAIPFFQEDTLTNKELKLFMDHLDECGQCKEELAINYLINEGILSLKDGKTFDLQQVMDSHMERAKVRLKRRRTLQVIIYGFEAALVIAIVVILALMAFR